ncbi:MAG: DUF3618 domain-containing protein [Pyrinomonadaceae bacterium]
MAEKSGDLENIDKIAAVTTTTERESGQALEGRGGEYSVSEAHQFGAAPVDDKLETEHIKAQIEETRSNMGETIDAIQDRLSFSNISEQVSEQVNNAIETAKDNVYEATVGKAVSFMKNTGNDISRSSLVTTARENPLPFILIGVGAGILAYNSMGKKKPTSQRGYRTDSGHGTWDYKTSEVHPSDTKEYRQSALESAKDKIGGVKNTVSDAVGTAYEGVSNAAGSTYSGAAELANSAYEKAGEFGTKAQETYTEYLEEKPWAIGAVALIAGAAVGLAIPSTRYEGELMGEARVNLMSKAQNAASDLVDNAKQIASDAGNTIKDEIKTLAQETPNKL